MSPLHWKVGSGIILLPRDLVSISEPLKPLLLQLTQLDWPLYTAGLLLS